ncbi:MAG TPA: hypothetical protein V6D18_21390 [Thermosynechococcaceae cyanobacterium]
MRRKCSAFDIEDLPGLWRVHWQLGNTTIFSSFYTRIDQACLLWGIISGIIFITAQFSCWDWGVQAWLWSGLTIAGSVSTALMAPHWLKVKPLSRTFSAWVGLMLIGTALTDLSIFLGWSDVLMQLCPLWLALTALGYFYTGIEMRSRGFLLISLIPTLGIFLMPYLGVWQFSTTGLLIGLSMIAMAELQWDSSGVCANHKLDADERA